ELMPHHVLGQIDRDELVAVVYGERMTDELRGDRRSARPGLDDALLPPRIHLLDLPAQALIDVRALLQTAGHKRNSFERSAPTVAGTGHSTTPATAGHITASRDRASGSSRS